MALTFTSEHISIVAPAYLMTHSSIRQIVHKSASTGRLSGYGSLKEMLKPCVTASPSPLPVSHGPWWWLCYLWTWRQVYNLVARIQLTDSRPHHSIAPLLPYSPCRRRQWWRRMNKQEKFIKKFIIFVLLEKISQCINNDYIIIMIFQWVAKFIIILWISYTQRKAVNSYFKYWNKF